MIERDINPKFNPEKLYIQFSEMWKTAEKLGRGQYTHYESFSKSFFLLDMERAILLQRAIDLCSFRNVDCEDIEFNDITLDSTWVNITPNIRSNLKKWNSAKKGGKAKVSKSKAKKQPAKTKKNTEIVEEESAVKDLTKSECVSLICLSLSIDSSLAIEIYQYRVLKKAMNNKRALDTFFTEINDAIDKSKKPVQDVLNYYLSSSYRAFEASWFIESVARKTQSNQEVNALNAVGFEHLPKYQVENLMKEREKTMKERGLCDKNKGIEQGYE
jgi:hypothetical protein